MPNKPAQPDDGQKRRRWRSEAWGRVWWGVNLALGGGICVWILADGRFPQTVAALQAIVSSALGTGAVDVQAAYWPSSSWRLTTLVVLAPIAAASLINVFVTLLVGAARHRSLRAWLAFTLLVAGWLALITNWREVAWRGQQWRVWAHLDGFSSLAETLRTDWPEADDERTSLGAFMAYPRGEPRTLLLLTPPAAPETGLSFSAIEREGDTALRFELAGNEEGAWLEWHAPGELPSSFVGGLVGRYELQRYASLGDGWYLARYFAN